MMSMNSSSSSSSPVFIDLTDDEPLPVTDKDVTDALDMSVYLRELETLRMQNRNLQHENSELKRKVRDTEEELKITRESLGQVVVAMQRKTSVTLDVPFGASSNSESSTRIQSAVASVDMPKTSKVKDKMILKNKCKMEEDERKIKVDPCQREDDTIFIEQLESTRTTIEHPEIPSNSPSQSSKRCRIDQSNSENRDRVSKTSVNAVGKGMSPQRTPIISNESRRVKKVEKSDENKDVFAYLYHNTKSYLKSAKTFKIHPSPPDTRIRRVEFAKHYGGSAYQFLQFIRTRSGKVTRRMVFPQPEMNPAVPAAPGEPGLIFASRHEILENPPWSLFVKCNPAVAIWTYMGDYESVICGRLEADQFRGLSDKVKNRWGEFLGDQQLDVYLSMRVRIALRKAGVIPMEDKDEEKECIDKAKRAVKSGKAEYAVTRDDVIKAFSEGDECIDIILMTCTSYDHDFARDIQRTFNDPMNAARGLPNSNAPKGSTESETSTTTPKSAKGKTQGRSNSESYLGDMDEDDWQPSDDGDDFIGPAGSFTHKGSHRRRSGRQIRRKTFVLNEDEDDEDEDMYL